MARTKYLYRVTAYRDRAFDPGEYAETRCYQTERAARIRAELWRKGRESDEFGEPPLAPAKRVTVERSAPVAVWEPFEVAVP